MKRLLSYFSFRGRANRARYWLTVLSIVGVFIATGLVAAILVQVPVLGILAGIALLVGIPAALVVSLANGARRLHDRGKSAWWLLVFMGLPMLLSIPAQLTVGGGPGALRRPEPCWPCSAFRSRSGALSWWGACGEPSGPNKYGDDPLQVPAKEAFA